MKVILTQTVAKIGKEGQVVNVANGFARNFLFPRQLARLADKPGIARLEREKGKVTAEAEKTRGSAEGISEKLKGATIRLTGSTAKGSAKLFGAVTASDIAEAIKKDLGVDIDKRSVALMHPIKRLGKYNVMIDLHRDVDATIHLEVADEEGWLGVVEPVAKPLPEGTEETVEAAPRGKKRDKAAQKEEAKAAEEEIPAEEAGAPA